MKNSPILNDVLDLSKKLISIQSDPGNTAELEECLQLCLDELEDFTIEIFERNNIKSALIYNTKTRPDKFKIILNGHLDVIPGKKFQYNPEIKGNRMYGVGALDMKTNLSCLIMTFKEIASKVSYPLGLQLVTDEEVGGFDGTKYQIEGGVRADFVIAGETTNLNIVNKAKGIMWLKISSKGVTAHGAYPWKGTNAIWEMNSFLNKLQKRFPIPKRQAWVTTVNLSKIATTNNTFNKIPDNCEIYLDIRYIPEDKKILLEEIKRMMPKGFKMEIVANEPSLFVEEKNKYIQHLKTINKEVTKNEVVLYGAQGSSDSRHFTEVGCDGIEFGPIGGGIGSDEEWIDIPSLEQYIIILKRFLLSMK